MGLGNPFPTTCPSLSYASKCGHLRVATYRLSTGRSELTLLDGSTAVGHLVHPVWLGGDAVGHYSITLGSSSVRLENLMKTILDMNIPRLAEGRILDPSCFTPDPRNTSSRKVVWA